MTLRFQVDPVHDCLLPPPVEDLHLSPHEVTAQWRCPICRAWRTQHTMPQRGAPLRYWGKPVRASRRWRHRERKRLKTILKVHAAEPV